MTPQPWTFERAFPNAMTVGELIERLLLVPVDAFVTSEGCDCDGPVADLMIDSPLPPDADGNAPIVVTLMRQREHDDV